jgi:iron complex transport system permease protein
VTAAPVRGWVLRSRRDRLSVRVDGRTAAACLALLLGAAGAGTLALTVGDYPLSTVEVLRALAGRGSPAAEFIVGTLRLPRLLTGLLVGAALGASGAVLQSLSRNPLGSPDIVGFTSGSATGALVVITLLHGGLAEIAIGAVAGGVATSMLVFVLVLRRGAAGLRLVLVGIGVSALLVSANHYLITRATLGEALAAQVWLTGSLNERTWGHVWPAGLAVAVLLPVALGYGRRLALLELGDEAATGLGVPVPRSRLVLVLVSVGLAAAGTAAAGPIAFVALAAPHLARRLTRSAGPAVAAAALVGALLLTGCDQAVQRVFGVATLPVGVATGAVGGLYLVWLLGHEWRRGGR